MRHAVALAIALTASGCSIWNKLDPNLLDAGPSFDAGDASFDAPFDGGEDAPDGGTPRRELICNDNMDNDRDGVTDCADTDCSSNAEICCDPAGVRPPQLTEAWCAGIRPSEWNTPMPRLSVMGAGRCTVGQISGLLVGSAVHDTCVPLASGATITVEMQWSGTCAECEATLALSPIPEADASTGILSELAVVMHEEGEDLVLDLTRAGRRIGRLSGLERGLVRVRLRLFPGVDDGGRPALRAALFAEDEAMGHELEALDALAFPDDLAGAGLGCTVAPGLFVGVQTRGSAGRIGELVVVPEGCPNPNFFRGAARLPVAWLEADDLALSSTWTAGGIGGASVVPLVMTGRIEWQYFVDGTNLNRANDGDQALDFSFGVSMAEDDGLTDFMPRSSSPLAGHATPTCDGGSDCGVFDFREPAAFIPVDGDGNPMVGEIFWVEVEDDGTSRLLHAPYNASTTVAVSGTPVFSTPPCARIRHPSVVPLGSTSVLLFACDDEIRAVPLTGLFVPAGPATSVVSAAALGFPLGIVDLDATVRARGPVTTFQLWVAGRDALGLTRLALAEGSSTGAGLPTLTPFAGNPVLSVGDPIIADGCDGVCRLTAVGVAREPETDLVRVVLSVTDESKTAVRHAIVPLEQTLP